MPSSKTKAVVQVQDSEHKDDWKISALCREQKNLWGVGPHRALCDEEDSLLASPPSCLTAKATASP